ncbi:MAG: [NiFe]-hydrogenase assembly chaperone HybE [Burkholderiales bacterium]|nr:[NiFe]-hydrogenase assembly chaperone HybE [Burkholderiales bacterium]
MTSASSCTLPAGSSGGTPVGAAAQQQDAARQARLAARVRELQALFEHIAATRMAGVALLHDGLQVQAIGFQPDQSGQPDPAKPAGSAAAPTEPAGAVGILVTPWFMNLVWLPLDPAAPTVRVGDKRTRVVGNERFDFIGAHEPGFGGYEACSLFSPMFEFVDHGAAVATAFEVLKQLRAPKAESTDQAAQVSEADHWAAIMSPGEPEQGPEVDTPPTIDAAAEIVPSRRALLFGRAATGATAP